MASEEQLKALLAAADTVLPTYRTKKGRSLTDPEAAAAQAISKFWLLFDDGVKDGQMQPYLGVATLYELEQQLGVVPKNRRVREHASTLAREARQLYTKRQREDLDAALRLRAVPRESTTADISKGTDPLTFEDPEGQQGLGDHNADE